MTWLHVRRSDSPLILAFPHGGTDIPPALLSDFRSGWWAIRDADWHIRALYDGLAEATMIWTDVSRSVIDCNRDPSGASLYPGQATTGLCPTETFDGEPLYRGRVAPDVAARRETWFAPYHAAIEAEIARLRALHPRVVIYDCHSIRSHIPRLFDGQLPELNIGTDNGATCDPALSDAVVAQSASRSHVLNGWPRSTLPRFPYNDLAPFLLKKYFKRLDMKAGQAYLGSSKVFHWSPSNLSDTERVAALFAAAGVRIPTQDDWRALAESVREHGIYNQNLQAVPPTGSISYINHSTSSIHPIASKIEIRKEGKIGRVYYPAPFMDNDNLEYFQDAYEIGFEKIIDTYAEATQHVDQGLSLTLFFKDTATTRDLNKAQIYAWRKGIKTIYYVRLRQMALEGTEVEGCVSCML